MQRFIYSGFFFLICFLFVSCASPSLSSSPEKKVAVSVSDKYASTTVPLKKDHRYFKENLAPVFWELISFYVPQEEHACSAASLVMILNAIKSKKTLKASDDFIFQRPLIEKVNSPEWRKAIETGNCPDLDLLVIVLKTALKVYGFNDVEVEAVHLNDLSLKTRASVTKVLKEGEKSAQQYILANFLQGVLTGDSSAMDAGHFSPVGAYDKLRHRVLILDVDRQWYEPYWVSEEVFLQSMNTLDKAVSRYRGFIRILIP